MKIPSIHREMHLFPSDIRRRSLYITKNEALLSSMKTRYSDFNRSRRFFSPVCSRGASQIQRRCSSGRSNLSQPSCLWFDSGLCLRNPVQLNMLDHWTEMKRCHRCSDPWDGTPLDVDAPERPSLPANKLGSAGSPPWRQYSSAVQFDRCFLCLSCPCQCHKQAFLI